MHFAFFDGLKIRRSRSVNPRHAARSRRPALEAMEDRRLLSANPYMLISSAHVTEGTGGQTEMSFSVNLTSPATRKITVDYRTIDRTAKAGSDYMPVSGELTFAPGQMVKTVDVPIVGDSQVELTEAFYTAIYNAHNARVIKSIGVGSILDDDTAVAPKLSVNDVAMSRGMSGSKQMTFTVSLNTKVDKPVTVMARTRAITARAGVDFNAKTKDLTFAPGETTKQFTVTVFGTPNPTSDKIFFVDLTDASVTLAKSTSGGIIKYGA